MSRSGGLSDARVTFGVALGGAALAALVSTSGVGCKPPTARQIYDSQCAMCHGSNGSGGVTVGSQKSRNFRDPEFQRTRSDAELLLAIKTGKPPGMPAFGTRYDDAQLKGLVAIVRSFGPPGSQGPETDSTRDGAAPGTESR